MSEHLQRIARRREALIQRCEMQRRTLADQIEPWRRPLDLAGRGLAVVQAVRAHPAWLVGAAVLPGVLLPGRVGTWLRRGFMAVQLVRRLRSSAAVQSRDALVKAKAGPEIH